MSDKAGKDGNVCSAVMIILFLDKMVRKPFYRRINILHRLRRKKQYYTAFRGGFAAMPLTSGIIKRLIRFIRNKYKTVSDRFIKKQYHNRIESLSVKT